MRIKKIIVSILAFSMVFGLENIKVYAIRNLIFLIQNHY